MDAADYEWLMKWKWRVIKFKGARSEYVARTERDPIKKQSRTILMHRAIMGFPKIKIDHVDCNGFNNSRANLREATPCQNKCNTPKYVTNTSGVKGVRFYEPLSKFVARIGINNKRIHLGYFKTLNDAALAYAEAAKKYHGEFLHL